MNEPERKTPAKINYSFRTNQNNIINVTICTKKRKQILHNDTAHSTLLNAWLKADEWLVGKYVIMPDHIHLLCAPTSSQSPPLANWIRYWKSNATKNWHSQADKPIWQQGKWDRQVRLHQSYSAQWKYIFENPIRANFVAEASDWPFKGELTKFHWYDR